MEGSQSRSLKKVWGKTSSSRRHWTDAKAIILNYYSGGGASKNKGRSQSGKNGKGEQLKEL